MPGEEKHSAQSGVRKSDGGTVGGGGRDQIPSAKAQLAAIKGGLSEKTRRYGIKQQPMGQRPPAESNIEKG